MRTAEEARAAIVADACVLINFALVDRIDILCRLPKLKVLLLEDVRREVEDEEQRSQVESAVSNGDIEVVEASGFQSLVTYAELRGSLGPADAACVAYAEANGCLIASDDKVVQREVTTKCGKGRVINTPGLLVLAIRNKLLTIEEADAVKATLAERRFVMNFDSFRERV